jgi:hypothetical protein
MVKHDELEQRYTPGSIRTDTEVQAAGAAWVTIKKTLDTWVTIGRGVARIRERATQIGGRKTFARLMADAGLGELTSAKLKAVCSKLETIMRPENLTQVQAWHNKLPLEKRLAWCSPSSVVRNCPVFTEGKTKRQQPAQLRRPPKPNVEVAIDTIADYCRGLAADERAAVLTRIGATMPEPDFHEALDLLIESLHGHEGDAETAIYTIADHFDLTATVTPGRPPSPAKPKRTGKPKAGADRDL